MTRRGAPGPDLTGSGWRGAGGRRGRCGRPLGSAARAGSGAPAPAGVGRRGRGGGRRWRAAAPWRRRLATGRRGGRGRRRLGLPGGVELRARGGPTRAERAGARVEARRSGRGDRANREAPRGVDRRSGRVRPDGKVSAGVWRRRRLGFRGKEKENFGGGLYIGIEGARRVQMRCGFRPRDRD